MHTRLNNKSLNTRNALIDTEVLASIIKNAAAESNEYVARKAQLLLNHGIEQFARFTTGPRIGNLSQTEKTATGTLTEVLAAPTLQRTAETWHEFLRLSNSQGGEIDIILAGDSAGNAN